jgi:hypothetical protein
MMFLFPAWPGKYTDHFFACISIDTVVINRQHPRLSKAKNLRQVTSLARKAQDLLKVTIDDGLEKKIVRRIFFISLSIDNIVSIVHKISLEN